MAKNKTARRILAKPWETVPTAWRITICWNSDASFGESSKGAA
jgi:hypothetical protein